MKQLFTLMALLLTSVTFGQETCNNVFDYNDNNTIDIEDFLAILGLFADVDLDDDGTWDSLDNCLDLSACNYASELNEPCTYLPPGDCDCNGNVLDECGVCGGTGLAPGTCDCNGTLIDVIGECGGSCWVDEDADGICDDVDECVGEYDACDVCNGPGAIYECGCANIPEGECDCDGNVLDAIGVCGGACSADEDADGVCDDVDDCVGEFDVCGVCNGPGEVYECGCSDVPEGECDCEGNVLDALGECGGECSADEDGDGVCDDVDDCVGEFDECGVCNGDGAVYECGCNDIPEGECDCDGNVFDECGVCNGPGPTEIVIEDIVTYYDSVYLPFDDAWYVYPVDADTTFGYTCAQLFSECGDPVSYQGYDYATVQIGDQCWFAENLRSENYENGDSIPSYLSGESWSTTNFGAVAVYGEGNSTCSHLSPDGNACDESWSLNEYGRLYNWHAVKDERGLCPSGWHVSKNDDWRAMESMYFDPAYFSLPCDWCIGSQYFKADYGWQWNDGLGGSGNNESGFTGLPGGIRDGEEDWGSRAAGRIGAWWSPHESEDFVGLSRQYDPSDDAIVGQMSLNSGRSVRCVLDAPQVLGCTEASACNYDEQANNDDGSCEYESCVPAIHPCGDPVSYQGYEYATVQIGEQCWFAENLRNEYYQNGDSIDSNLSQDEWVNAEGGATVVYGGAAECENPGVMFECGCMEAYSPDINACDPVQSLEEYGRLYNWHAVNDARGLCPVGWRVPTDDEWIGLELALGMDTSEAYLLGGRGSYYDSEGIDVGVGWKMRTEYGWASWGDAGNGSNSSGFSGLPGGSRGSVFGNAGYTGTFWTSTLNLDNLWTAFYRELYTNSIRNVSNHSSGHSVRCIEQELVLGCTNPSACNYNPTANQEDGTCTGISIESCDCNGNVLDAIGECGGSCTADDDGDGICDDVDDCIGQYDPCGTCNGTCSGPLPGCVDSEACNYNELADYDDGSCEYESCAPVLHPCGDPVSYQGYEYATVQIGEQCWFAENLQSQAYQNGDAIPGNLSDSEWESTLSGATTVLGEGDFECYSLSPEGNACDDVWSLQEYGRLYNWYAVSDSRGLCPNGWHVPTDGEWMTLESTLGMSASAANDTGFRGTNQGSQLKSSHGWYNGNNGTDDSGFGGLPGGYRNFWFNGYFNTAGMQGVWWSSSPDDTDAWYRLLTTAYDESGQSSFGGFGEHVFRSSSQPQVGFSVRCIQNTEE